MYPRFKLWVTLWVSSIVVCLSFLSYRHDLEELTTSSWTLQDRLVFFVSSISAVLSFLGILSTIFHGRERRTFGNPESVLVWSVCILWSIGSIVAIIDGTDENGDGITDENDQALLLNPSVLIFSFACIVTSVVMISSWFQQYVVSNDSPSVTYFMLLASMSFLAMVSSIAFRNIIIEVPVVSTTGWDDNTTSTDDFAIIQNETLSTLQNTTTTIRQCESTGNDCTRINFAIWMSAISGTCCCIMIPWTGISIRCKVDVCITLFIVWLVGAFLLTTMTAPKFSVVAMFFSIWICLFLALHLLILVSTYDDTDKENKSRRRTSQRFGRMDILDVAYDALDSTKKQKPTRSDSYKDLFEEYDDWSSMFGSESPPENALSHDTLFMQSVREQQRNERMLDARCVNRLELWSILLIVSTVCLTSLHFYQEDQNQQKNIYDKLFIAVPSISIVLSTIGMGTVLRTNKVSKIIEPTMIFTTALVWFCNLPVVAGNVSKGLLEFDITRTYEANIVLSSWAAVIDVLLLLTNWFNASVETQDFVLLASCSVSLFASSLKLLLNNDDADGSPGLDIYGNREAFLGIYGGGICALLSLLMTFVHSCISRWVQFFITLSFTCLWGYAVVVITFAGIFAVVEQTPAAGTADTILLALWINLFLSLDLSTMNFVIIWRECQDRNRGTSDDIASEDDPDR
eukprot:CAMPEP_0113467916 /NCGR_PEP_ID=MMETSP0014_2-20120614/15068_1 /TAXON_ID=2857 /ORGANISM="Nitzschia sp." /LENGTH=685 /DNA_ID=CAMNT_0000360253 /DNA_START=448 /DNA_END=2505 /DNA_ORIENTATION=- /assembly_acc=CAM_ASM_000159